MTQEPFVSVAMITYNHEAYIAEAINGVVAQQCPFPVELVIGEDASTDDTRAIVADFARRYPSLIRPLFNEHNLGMMRNYIRTLQSCRGRYIAICEGDDYWTDPLKLRKQADYMSAHPDVAMCFHTVRMEYPDGRRAAWIKRSGRRNKVFSSRDVILGGGDLFQLNSVMIQQEVVHDLPRWFIEAPITDVPLALLALFKGKVSYINEAMGVHRCFVPNSWGLTIRSTPAYLAYFRKLAMLRKNFNAASGCRYTRLVTKKISANYKALIVQSPVRAEKKELYEMTKGDMTRLDGLISQLHMLVNIAGGKKMIKQACSFFSSAQKNPAKGTSRPATKRGSS